MATYMPVLQNRAKQIHSKRIVFPSMELQYLLASYIHNRSGSSKGPPKIVSLQDVCPQGGFLVKDVEIVICAFGNFWVDLTLLCANMCRFF